MSRENKGNQNMSEVLDAFGVLRLQSKLYRSGQSARALSVHIAVCGEVPVSSGMLHHNPLSLWQRSGHANASTFLLSQLRKHAPQPGIYGTPEQSLRKAHEGKLDPSTHENRSRHVTKSHSSTNTPSTHSACVTNI